MSPTSARRSRAPRAPSWQKRRAPSCCRSTVRASRLGRCPRRPWQCHRCDVACVDDCARRVLFATLLPVSGQRQFLLSLRFGTVIDRGALLTLLTGSDAAAAE